MIFYPFGLIPTSFEELMKLKKITVSFQAGILSSQTPYFDFTIVGLKTRLNHLNIICTKKKRFFFFKIIAHLQWKGIWE